jgi:ribosomal protein L37AE/L43A
MARADFVDLPRRNPCAQCGRPISMPEWIETHAQRTAYLWHCHACDYRFEAVAYFDEVEESIAA